jgi:hypothetical protein
VPSAGSFSAAGPRLPLAVFAIADVIARDAVACGEARCRIRRRRAWQGPGSQERGSQFAVHAVQVAA